jgi:uncharacterized protein (TIGR03086 family)
MAAYVISEVEVLDESQGQRYRDLASASIARYGGRYVVRGANPDVPEGDWPSGQRVVVVEFPSMEQLRSWYDSPEYAEALSVRRTALRRRLLFVEGVDALEPAPAPRSSPSVEKLGQALAAVGDLVTGIRPTQWSAPTPCTDWTARQLVNHLVGMNRVFAALLGDQSPPRPSADHLGDDPPGAYHDSAVALRTAFDQPGVLARSYQGPLGAATGAERLQIRLYDLLAHGWDLAQATGQPAVLPDDLAEQALAFVRTQLSEQARTTRFGPAQLVADDAPAIERLVAFLGRSVDTAR